LEYSFDYAFRNMSAIYYAQYVVRQFARFSALGPELEGSESDYASYYA
jgi:hypothetical protein